jgi:hypothetical protein
MSFCFVRGSLGHINKDLSRGKENIHSSRTRLFLAQLDLKVVAPTSRRAQHGLTANPRQL